MFSCYETWSSLDWQASSVALVGRLLGGRRGVEVGDIHAIPSMGLPPIELIFQNQ